MEAPKPSHVCLRYDHGVNAVFEPSVYLTVLEVAYIDLGPSREPWRCERIEAKGCLYDHEAERIADELAERLGVEVMDMREWTPES